MRRSLGCQTATGTVSETERDRETQTHRHGHNQRQRQRRDRWRDAERGRSPCDAADDLCAFTRQPGSVLHGRSVSAPYNIYIGICIVRSSFWKSFISDNRVCIKPIYIRTTYMTRVACRVCIYNLMYMLHIDYMEQVQIERRAYIAANVYLKHTATRQLVAAMESPG